MPAHVRVQYGVFFAGRRRNSAACLLSGAHRIVRSNAIIRKKRYAHAIPRHATAQYNVVVMRYAISLGLRCDVVVCWSLTIPPKSKKLRSIDVDQTLIPTPTPTPTSIGVTNYKPES